MFETFGEQDGGRAHEVFRQRKLLRRILSEPIPYGLEMEKIETLGRKEVSLSYFCEN